MDKKEEKIKLNPDQIRKLQLKSLEILDYFKEFCEKNNLLFYLCGGCCIGALRHKGFIPWDDDIDVFMPRDDYEKLYNLWNKKADNERFLCLRTNEKKFFGNIFITISDNSTTLIKPYQKNLDIPHGLVMDVFPLDGCPEHKIKRKIQKIWALVYSLYMAQIPPVNHGKLVNLAGKILLGIIPGRRFRYRIARYAEKKMSKYSMKSCKRVTELCAGPGYMRNEYPVSAFKSAVYKEFENRSVPIPCGYDEYLKMAFGDYMKIPPKDEQTPHHDIIFIDLENSYKKYKGIKYLMEEKI